MDQTKDKTFAVIDVNGLDHMIEALIQSGRKVIGPTVREHAIVYSEVRGVDDLPKGWTDEQEPGSYRLRQRDDEALFGYNVGPHTWKQHLFPPRKRVWQLTINGDRFQRTDDPKPDRPMAFLGVRACELAAIRIQDKVLMQQEYRNGNYALLRGDTFIIAVNCGEAGVTCFCDSMQTGPQAGEGFDLALTELIDDARHMLLVEIGTGRGRSLIKDTPHRNATQKDHAAASRAIENARQHMGRSMRTDGLPALIARNLEHPQWEEIAKRCLSCANCTLVCPTCFCSRFEDTSDLTGEIAERWQVWDSCFNDAFAYVHGGSVRSSTASRYRQWMSHKLSTWHDQFGTSGCVGCGRCITWCPVGIDLTVEAAAMHERDGEPA